VAQLAPGSVFAGFRIDGVAGRGGMGVVYRATELALDRTVALKLIADGALGDAGAGARSVLESRLAASIEHPNVIPIHAAGEHEGVAYIVMRYVRGEDLAARLRRTGPLGVREATAIVAQVAAALDAAHAAGLVHRDVKPANVLLAADDHVYLTDFGVARDTRQTSGLTRTGDWVGTLDYVAPEQIRGERIDHRADVYSLGCVLCQALTGRVPFPRESDEGRLWAHLHAVPPRPSAGVRGVPRAFDAVVARALAKDPADRWQTAGDLGAAVLAARDGRPLPAGSAATTRRGRGLRAGRGWTRVAPRRALAVVLAVVAVLGAGAAVLASRGDDDAASGGMRAGGPRVAPRPAPQPLPRVTAKARVLDRPRALAATRDAVWVTGDGGNRLVRLASPSLRRVAGAVVGRGGRDLVLRRGELWVAVPRSRRVVRVDADDGSRRRRPIVLPVAPAAIDAGEGAVWVAEQDPAGGPATLTRIDPAGNRVSGTLAVPEGINDVRAGLGAVWVVVRSGTTLLKVDPRTLQVRKVIPVGPKALRADVGDGWVWVTNHDDDSVARVDPRSGEIFPIGVPRKPFGIAVRGRYVWVASFFDSTLARIDTRSFRVVGTPIPVGTNPVDVVAGPDAVWVAGRGDDSVTQIAYR
jgi:DNA-binding beta-propeller fold protein YncE